MITPILNNDRHLELGGQFHLLSLQELYFRILNQLRKPWLEEMAGFFSSSGLSPNYDEFIVETCLSTTKPKVITFLFKYFQQQKYSKQLI